MGIVISFQPDEDSPANQLPWLVTFQPSDDLDEGEDWDSFSCGPYPREHAEALAEAVAVETEGITAIVEPINPVLDVQGALALIAKSREDAALEIGDETADSDDDGADDEDAEESDLVLPEPAEVRAGIESVTRRLLAHINGA
ncbi:MAG: hypothetical protein M3548_12835 [Actinomycetota bacterium]|nr:hypothetical protein [Actinomycetota bacterium]